MPLEDNNSPQITSSLTALAFPPGVLNTTTPFSVAMLKGIWLTPAPARQIHFSDGLKSFSIRL